MSRRYRSLDHWRGAAALWVMAFHSFNVWIEEQPEKLPGWLGSLLEAGWLGVPVFFVISRYCIAERIARDYATGQGAGRFLCDRGLRIFPVYWCALALAVAIDLVALPFNHAPLFSTPSAWGALPGSPGELAANIFFVERWSGHDSRLLVSWSLLYEVGFYAVAAAALGLMNRWRTPYPPAIVAAGCLLVVAVTGGAVGAPLDLFPQFLLGSLVWLCLHRTRVSAAGRAALACCALGLIWVAAPGLSPGSAIPLRLAALVASALVVLQPLDDRIAGARWLDWLGRAGLISYSLYLVHAPIVGKFRNLAFHGISSSGPWAVLVPVTGCALAFGGARLFHRVIEAPLERLRRRLLSRPAQTPSP